MQLPWPLSDKSNAGPRSVASKRFSEFFHGTSYVSSHRSRNHRGRKSSRIGPQRLPLHNRLDSRPLNSSPSGSRSPTSIRSMIDPNSSPSNSSRPPPAATFDRFQSSSPNIQQSRILEISPAYRPEQSTRQQSKSGHWQPLKWRPWKDGNRSWLSSIKNKTIRKRVITCIMFGVVLALIFIIFLALSVSNSVASQEFHIILILFILIFTVLFCHSLIRVFMLVFRPRNRERAARVHHSVDSRGFAYPSRPIRVEMAADEELDLGGNDGDAEKELAPPPPVYGLWRGSVRVDPSLLHWQRIEHPAGHANIAERLGDSENRPPSYISEVGMEHPAVTVQEANGSCRSQTRILGGESF